MIDRNKPTAGFWITVALVMVLLGYPLSFGPACWVSSHLNAGTRAVAAVYRPITWGLNDDHKGKLDGIIRWYARLGAAHENWGWWNFLSDDPDEWTWRIMPSA